jgi:hypothetical protein
MPVAATRFAQMLPLRVRPRAVVRTTLGNERQRLQGMRHFAVGEFEIAMPAARFADHEVGACEFVQMRTRR